MLGAKRSGWLVVMFMGWLCWQVSPSEAQRRRSAAGENLSLTTKDGVQLKATYYASDLGKEAVPVVMLHDFKESRTVFNGLAQALQSPPEGEGPSHAIITVDLRGHGESTSQQNASGQTRELESARLGKQDFRNMVLYDMEAVRKFLVQKNDAGELNLNKLCLLGSGMGANVATSWAAVDWSAPQLANRKQGQDVKGLILTSPDWNYSGLPLLRPLKHPGVREKISILLIYGKQDRKAAKSAETVHKNLERYHPDPPPGQGPEKKDLVLIDRPTSLQGTRLLTDPNFGMLPDVAFFLDARLSQQDYPWIQRRGSN
jgi:predicted esterase